VLLNKDDILKARDSKYLVVNVPEWGGDVKLKTMSVAEQIQYEKLQEDKDNNSLILNMLIFCCVDEDDNKLFEKEDLVELQKKSAHPICHLFREALKLNSLSQKNVEEGAKNS